MALNSRVHAGRQQFQQATNRAREYLKELPRFKTNVGSRSLGFYDARIGILFAFLTHNDLAYGKVIILLIFLKLF